MTRFRCLPVPPLSVLPADPHQSELQLPPAPPSVLPYGQDDAVVVRVPAQAHPLQPLIVVPMVDSGAAGAGVLELVRNPPLAQGRDIGLIVVAEGGSRTDELAALGAEWFPMRVASINPLVMLANVPRMVQLIRARQC